MQQSDINTIVDNFYESGKITAVGARYGDAPECGRSFNTASNRYEAGVSMMQVNDLPGIRSFAVAGAMHRKVRYYIGTVINTTGGDDEFLMQDVKPITKAQYNKFAKSPEGKLSSLVVLFWHTDKLAQIGISHMYPQIYQKWEDAYQAKLAEVLKLG